MFWDQASVMSSQQCLNARRPSRTSKTQANSRQVHRENTDKPHWLAQLILPLWTKMNQACRFTWRSVAHLLAKRFIEAACGSASTLLKLKRSGKKDKKTWKNVLLHSIRARPLLQFTILASVSRLERFTMLLISSSQKGSASEEALRFISWPFASLHMINPKQPSSHYCLHGQACWRDSVGKIWHCLCILMCCNSCLKNMW